MQIGLTKTTNSTSRECKDGNKGIIFLEQSQDIKQEGMRISTN